MGDLTHILEFTRVGQARQIDEEQGVLHDLAALGPESANGRDWPESTMRAMLPFLEGRQAFADHNRQGEPSVYHVLGVWRNCRVEGGKTRGDFHFFKSHPMAPRLVEAARRPELNNALGFSVNARGRMAHKNGRNVVESVDEVISIDCVAQPATLAGLYESRNPPVKRKLKELIESLKAKRPGYAKALLEMAEAGLLSPDAAMDPPPDATDPDEGKDHKTALMDALKALCDEADTMDEGELLKKFKAILKLVKGDGGGSDTASDSESAATEESRKLKTQNASLLAEKLVRKEASAAGLSLPESLVETVARPGMTEAQAKAAVTDLKNLGAGSQRPRSAGPVTTPAGGKVQESRGGAGDIPADAKARAAWLARG